MVSGRSRTISTGEEPSSDRTMCDPRRRMPSCEKTNTKMPDKDISVTNKMKRETARSFSADNVTPIGSDYGFGTESLISSRLSDRSMSIQSDSYHSTHSTPSNISYDSGFGYKYVVQNPVNQNKVTSANSHMKSNAWDKRSSWGDSSSPWEDNNSPAWDNHRSAKRHVTPPSTPVTPVPKQSPIRESLDSRIELLLKQTDGKSLFLDLGAVSKQIGDVSINEAEKKLMGPPLPWSDAPPLPPDISPLPPLPESDEPPPPPPEEEDDLVLLSTPPSPFISFTDYHKWAVITSDIDSGKLTSLSEIPDREDAHLEHPIPIKGVRLSTINWKANSMPLEKTDDSPILQDKGDSTPVRDEPPIEDDDKMSLSSLSDGENKLEVHIPSASDNTTHPGTPQKAINHVLSSSVPNATYSSLYSSQSSGTTIYPVSDAAPYSASSYSANFANSVSAPYVPHHSAPGSAGTSSYPPSTPASATSALYPPSASASSGSGPYPSSVPASAGSASYPTSAASSAGSSAYPPLPHPLPAGAALYPSTAAPQFPSQGVYTNPPLPPVASTSAAPTNVPPARSSIPYLASSATPSQVTPTSHPMYPSEHVQMMARMGLWRPGMGSGIPSTPPASTSSFGGSSQTPYAPTSFFPPRPSLTGSAYSAATVPFTPPSNIAEMVMRPPPGYPALPMRPLTPSPFPVLSQFSVPPPDTTDPHAPTVTGVLACIIKELKQVMKKDICKRMIEVTAFKRFEQWWEENLHQEKVFFILQIDIIFCIYFYYTNLEYM